MIDVFLRWYPQNDLRYHFARAVRERLLGMPHVNLRTLGGGWNLPAGAHIPEPYHINSKKYAEENATTDIYCVMDDDQLPLRDDFFSFGAAVLHTHPEYGMLAGFPLEYGLQGQPYAEMKHAMIVDAHAIGCPYWVRKGTLKHFPNSAIHFYDGDLSKVVTDQGLKTGLMPAAVYNHLGYGFSQVGKLQQ